MTIDNPSTVAITTTTHYPRWYRGKLRSLKHTDKVRGDLALELVQTAVGKGYRMVVADWQSSGSFRQSLAAIKEAIIIKRRSIKPSPSRRQAIKKAAALDTIEIVIITEPEKISLIADCLPIVIQPLLQKTAEIVVPKRNLTLFKKTYPFYQYDSEQEGNLIYNEALRSYGFLKQYESDFDLFFGPCAFLKTKKLIKLFMKQYQMMFAHDEPYSNTRNFPIITALKNKMAVANIEVPFAYPNVQKLSEEKSLKALFMKKRKMQKRIILIEMLHFMSFLEKNPGSRIKS